MREGRFKGVRRSRLEITLEVLTSVSRPPGKTITEILSEQGMSGTAVYRLIRLLLDMEMIQGRSLPTSPSGMRRECTYYTATEKGRRVIGAWRGLQRELET